MQHFDGNNYILQIDEKTDILFQICHFITNNTVARFYGTEVSQLAQTNIRMSQSSFSLKTRAKNKKAIAFEYQLQVSWMLWETKFKINSYSTISSNKNFTKYLDKIIVIDRQRMFPGTISETQYASGNKNLKHIVILQVLTCNCEFEKVWYIFIT